MNISETLQLIEALKSAGATHFKSQDFEINMNAAQGKAYSPLIPPPPETVAAPVVENTDATEKLKGLIDSLKMDDAQLLDKIFPAGAGG